MRSLHEIRVDIERASERRAELWRLLAARRDSAVAADLKELDERLAALWDEHRAVRARLLFGEHERIMARARTEERLERAA